MYPLIGLDPGDVREAFASIKTRDKDEWATAFMAVADRYMAEGKSLETSDPAKANADYIRAWRIYSFGRWPVPSSPGKQRAYAKALEAFRAHTKFLDPPLEVVHIPSPGRVLDAEGRVMPASYVNFYVTNANVVVPTYGAPWDDEAVETIGALFPGRRSIGIDARAILSGGGALHCITQQQPRTTP